MDLLERIKTSGHHKQRIKWPGSEEDIDMRLCAEEDYLRASIATDKTFSDTRISLLDKDAYNSELETQLLFRILENPETGKQLFNRITDFRMVLVPEIKDKLVEEMNKLHEEYSPNPVEMSDEEFDKLVVNIKKNVEQTIGNVSSLSTLRRLTIYMASQLWK